MFHTGHDRMPRHRMPRRGPRTAQVTIPDPATARVTIPDPVAELSGDPAGATGAAAGVGEPAWFVGTVMEGPGRRRVLLRGDIGAVAADRLGGHLDDICDTTVRHIIVDATEVRRCDPLVVELLGRTQKRLAARRGLVTVIGLPPRLRPLVATPPAGAEVVLHPAAPPEPGPGRAPAAKGR